jgi:hypothetical protein
MAVPCPIQTIFIFDELPIKNGEFGLCFIHWINTPHASFIKAWVFHKKIFILSLLFKGIWLLLGKIFTNL